MTANEFKRLQRIPLALVERTSLARGALPILPQTLAWICLIFNGFLPGTGGSQRCLMLCFCCFHQHSFANKPGTVLSGLLGICLGAPRFSALVTAEHRFLGFIINLTVGIFQAVTVLFCLVGWCWSLGWGIILVKTAGSMPMQMPTIQLWSFNTNLSNRNRLLQKLEKKQSRQRPRRTSPCHQFDRLQQYQRRAEILSIKKRIASCRLFAC